MSGAGAEEPLPPLREDALLGGRVRLLQPLRGYRAATDPVLLAAAVPVAAGERVLELGCGAGAAMLCLLARVPGADVTGLEREPVYARLARQNAALNGCRAMVIEGDIADPPRQLRGEGFDHVMLNPPYFDLASSSASAEPLRDRAHRADVPLASWFALALARLLPRGRVTVIHRAERLPEILAALALGAGDVTARPIAARIGRDAGRVLVTARKGTRGPFRLRPPLILHEGAAHLSDAEDFTAEATAILREAAPLPL